MIQKLNRVGKFTSPRDRGHSHTHTHTHTQHISSPRYGNRPRYNHSSTVTINTIATTIITAITLFYLICSVFNAHLYFLFHFYPFVNFKNIYTQLDSPFDIVHLHLLDVSTFYWCSHFYPPVTTFISVSIYLSLIYLVVLPCIPPLLIFRVIPTRDNIYIIVYIIPVPTFTNIPFVVGHSKSRKTYFLLINRSTYRLFIDFFV